MGKPLAWLLGFAVVAVTATACADQKAILCLDIEQGNPARIEKLRAIAREVSLVIMGDLIDRSEGGRISLMLDKDDARLTILSLGSDTPLVCFYERPDDSTAVQLIDEVVTRMRDARIGFAVSQRGSMHRLPLSLRRKISESRS